MSSHLSQLHFSTAASARCDLFRAIAGIAVFATVMLASSTPASAKRLAFVVGISSYKKDSGLEQLKAPVNDAAAIKTALDGLKSRFDTVTVLDKDLPNKAAFDTAFKSFTDRIQQGDEVLFYFSGHGNFVQGKGNLFLLPDAKGEQAYIKGLSIDEARALDTNERKSAKYQDWLSGIAVLERDVEEAIAARKPNVTIIIADACRTSLKGTKGATVDLAGIRMPQHTPRGTFRLYSAGIGQFSLDSIEPIFRVDPAKAADEKRAAKDDDSDDSDDSGKKKKRPTNSLFTKILLSDLSKPGFEFTVMAADIRNKVRNHADKLGYVQIPDYAGDPQNNEFYFSPLDQGEADAACLGADVELERLRRAVSAGSIGRDVLVSKRYQLAACGRAVTEQIDLLLHMEAQGASTATVSAEGSGKVDSNDAGEVCEMRASSPYDLNRVKGLPTDVLQQMTLAVLSGDVDTAKVKAEFAAITQVCEKALQERPKVARLSFLTGRMYQATASISTGLDKQQALASASAYLQQATDLGYAAAFNDLALLHKAGDYYAVSGGRAERRPADRAKALELLQRGAGLNHVVAQYNLGMAYLEGDLGITIAEGAKLDTIEIRKAEAFRYLSQSAERGFVPALIETAKLLHKGSGVIPNPKRAIELLEIAASRGSWEAMYWIGVIYRYGGIRDNARAIIWYARAAESGDARAQEQLAEMMTDGSGLPAPQPEAAGRYWRLAADAGRRRAQFALATRIEKGEIPFRPVLDGPPDGGALEIRNLLTSAFLRGDPKAGLELGRLFRSGYPKDNPSRAIPKSNAAAAKMFWLTIDAVRAAEPDSDKADPKAQVWAAFELIAIHDEEANVSGGISQAISEDQINQLRRDFGDGTRQHWIRVDAFGAFKCGGFENNVGDTLGSDAWVLVWNWTRQEPPTHMQFDWLERRYGCREKEYDLAKKGDKKPPSDDNIGFTKRTREKVAERQKDALKDTEKQGAKGKTFVDRMIALAQAKPSDD